jgi:trehalose utilization protein
VCFGLPAFSADAPKPVRVLIWDEQQPEQKQVYDNFLGNAIAAYLEKQPGFVVKSVNLTTPEMGLDNATLDATDVLIWWSHKKQDDVKTERVDEIVMRVMNGKLALIALHSAHFSWPFMRLMHERAKIDAPKMIPEAERGKALLMLSKPLTRHLVKRDSLVTPNVVWVGGQEPYFELLPPACVFPAWRADGEPSHVKTLLPAHPLAKGLPATWDIPHTEMYDEPFHVPVPDAVVFEERWDQGEHFRSGCVWEVGKGRVFYFRPGHETYPVYKQEEPLKVVANAARWLGEK